LLPRDALDCVFANITNPRDFESLLRVCVRIHGYLDHECTFASVRLYKNASIDVLGHMHNLRQVRITRKYDNQLDLSPLSKTRCDRLYINSPVNIVNPPKDVCVRFGKDVLVVAQRHSIASCETYECECESDDFDDAIMTAKEYFLRRLHRPKKYTNISTPYSNRSFQFKSRHIMCSSI
jgi:hypothetical protein